MAIWPFKKRPKPGRYLRIPQAHHRKFLELHDDFVRAYLKSKDLHLAQYDLWAFIREIFPETREGRWEVPFLRTWNDPWVVVEVIEE